jgi:hypothetical protein
METGGSGASGKETECDVREGALHNLAPGVAGGKWLSWTRDRGGGHHKKARDCSLAHQPTDACWITSRSAGDAADDIPESETDRLTGEQRRRRD